MVKITKAVIPAAGLGTRLLPVTKAMPKEMLPVVDKPAIQYIVEEAVRSGLEHVLFITGRNKRALEDHFDRAVELEVNLFDKGEEEKLSAVQRTTELADIHYVRQGDPNGLGHAVLKAQTFVGHESFAVLLGDDIIEENEHLLSQMLRLSEETHSNVVAVMEVPESDVSKYGIASVSSFRSNGVVEIDGFIEKPAITEAPSRFAIVGRYVLRPEIFKLLQDIQPGTGGEIQLTDALDKAARNNEAAGPVLGVIFTGTRYDTGDRLSYLKTIVSMAKSREDIGEEFTKWLNESVKK